MKSFRAVIELWPTREAMAASLGIQSQTVSKWWQRNSIPAWWWAAISNHKLARDGKVTPDLLARLSRQRWK